MHGPLSNRASVVGPSQFAWWPNWSGQGCAVIASGQSVKKKDIEQLRGHRVIAIKENVDLAPWADVVYGCDLFWWLHKRGLADYKGLRVAYDSAVKGHFPSVELVGITDKQCDRLLVDQPMAIGSGGNSGFQALNLAVQFGASRVLLLGFDMRGEHWYGRNNWDRANNPSSNNFKRWIKALDGVYDQLQMLGVEVRNCSAVSVLTKYKKTNMEDGVAWLANG